MIDSWKVDEEWVEGLPIPELLMAAMIDALALVIILIGRGETLPTLAAVAFHGVAAAVVFMSDRLKGSRFTLAVSLVSCLPLLGEPLALLALCTRRRVGPIDVAPEEESRPPVPNPEDVRRIVDAVPACEAILASTGEERQAMLATLIRRKDADAVTLLRWLVSEGGELAVEAALALEELSVRFDTELDDRRLQLEDEPSFAAALDAGIFVCDAIEAGIVDPVMIQARAEEARRFFAQAAELEPRGGTRLVTARARLEMAAMHPEAAVALLNQALALIAPKAVVPEELVALREEARLATHETLLNGWLLEGVPPDANAGGRRGVSLEAR